MTRFIGTARRAAMLAGAIVIAACGSTTGLASESYDLVSVNGDPLPAAYPHPEFQPDVYQVTRGRLTLNANGAFLLDLYMRCHPQQPAANCQVSGDGRQPMAGTFSRQEQYIRFGTRQYVAEFTNDLVRIHIVIPPSEGLYPSFILEFRR